MIQPVISLYQSLPTTPGRKTGQIYIPLVICNWLEALQTYPLEKLVDFNTGSALVTTTPQQCAHKNLEGAYLHPVVDDYLKAEIFSH